MIPGLGTRAIRGHMKAAIENPPTARLRSKIKVVQRFYPSLLNVCYVESSL